MRTRPPRPSIDEIATLCACLNVRRAARAVTQLYDHALAPTGLRATQLTLLVALERAGPVPFTRLAEVLGMDRTTLTRNAGPLQRDGLMVQRPGPDRRVKLMQISEAGRRILAAAIPLWQTAQRQITEGLGPGRWDAARKDLQRIASLAGEAAAD
jgi:DNA-binding MarR family transcriptional regulator